MIVRMSHSHVLIEKWQLNILSVFASALFLLHRFKTKSVYHMAGRFEVLSALSFVCACTIFLDGTRHDGCCLVFRTYPHGITLPEEAPCI